MDKKFIDSNIWLYRFLIDPKVDPQQYESKRLMAISLTQPVDGSLVISTQVITETCAVLKRKTNIIDQDILELVEEFEAQCEIVNLTTAEIKKACLLRSNYYFYYWDSLIIATALKSQAKVLYSEDMQHGLLIGDSLTILNPFVELGN
ncbi:PIN domain-containing protein [Coleofasciculus sp.]|uniref:PIN domain-containing protein n=1 Tax=Coleofasciculus sp. TaxID=3100458 RepID=UPI0039F8BA40